MHQHFLEGESAGVEVNTLEEEFDKKTKGKSKDHGGLAVEPVGEMEKECLNFYPRSKLFSSLLSR